VIDERTIDMRDAEPGDSARLTDIAHAAKRHWGYDEADIQRWSADLTITPAFLERHIVRVVTRSDELVAFYALRVDGATAEVEHYWVHSDDIGAGIGGRMFEDATQQAITAGANRLRIVSDPNAQGFYERMGAVLTGEEPSTPPGRVLPVLTVSLEQS